MVMTTKTTRVMSLTSSAATVDDVDIGPELTVEVEATFKGGLTVEGAAAFKKGLTQEGWKLVAGSECINPWTIYTIGQGRAEKGAAYFKDSLGMVHLKGGLRFIATRATPNAVSGQPLFQLPGSYRPEHDAHFATVYAQGSQFCVGRVEVKKDGNVILYFETPTPGECFLNGINFRAAS
jgi:hypothetical protein